MNLEVRGLFLIAIPRVDSNNTKHLTAARPRSSTRGPLDGSDE